MEKFEYRIYEFKRGTLTGTVLKNIERELNILGAEGWEVTTSSATALFSASSMITVILKRKIIE